MGKVYTKVYTRGIMRKLILLLVVVSIALSINKVSATNLEPCPIGSYPVGTENNRYICKVEPTGCPYGDSIPLGPACDKHKPVGPTVPQEQPISIPDVPSPDESWGK